MGPSPGDLNHNNTLNLHDYLFHNYDPIRVNKGALPSISVPVCASVPGGTSLLEAR
ncbi:MAG: hypothetical protein R2810_04800 [Flavobacteriales bacterium]